MISSSPEFCSRKVVWNSAPDICWHSAPDLWVSAPRQRDLPCQAITAKLSHLQLPALALCSVFTLANTNIQMHKYTCTHRQTTTRILNTKYAIQWNYFLPQDVWYSSSPMFALQLLIHSLVCTPRASNDIVHLHPSESNTFSQGEALKAIQTKASNQQCASNNTPTS